jgi:hypothetical protein
MASRALVASAAGCGVETLVLAAGDGELRQGSRLGGGGEGDACPSGAVAERSCARRGVGSRPSTHIAASARGRTASPLVASAAGSGVEALTCDGFATGDGDL